MSINYTGSGGGIPRKAAKIFAENATTDDVTAFGSTLAGSTVKSKDLDVLQTSRFEAGWRDAVISNLNYPLLGDMNAVQHTLSQQIAYILQHGCPEWNASTTYYAYDLVASGGIIYTSLIDENTNNVVSDTTKWAEYYNPANFANASLSNLNTTGEKHFLNKAQISDCILEAPNGVFTYSGATLTGKEGLKVLIPNGRNTDGTLKNIEITLDSDVSYTIPNIQNYTNQWYSVSINSNKEIGLGYRYYSLYMGDKQPSPSGSAHWFDTQNNIWKATNNGGSTWTEQNWCLVGFVYINTSTSSIASSVPFEPVNLLKKRDRYEISGWGMPSSTTMGINLGSPGMTFTAPTNGWVCFSGLVNVNGGLLQLQNQTTGMVTTSRGQSVGSSASCCLPCREGDVIKVVWDSISTLYQLRFYFAEGEA